MKRKISAFVTFIFIINYSIYAQVPSPLIFSRITKETGLASNTIFHSIRDKQGYMWIATQNGLQRYDGTRMLTFRHIPGNIVSLAKNTVNHLFIDTKERLWLLFDKEAGIFNRSNLTYTHIKINTAVNQIKKITEDDKGRIILLADTKQLLYNEASHSFNDNYPLPAFPLGYAINDMAIDFSTANYLLTGKQGSLVYNANTKQYYTKQSNKGDALLDSFCAVKNARYPFIAKDGTYWMVHWVPFTAAPPVLYSYNGQQKTFQKFEKIRPYKADSYYEIWGVFEQSNGTIWIYGMGLLAYYNKTANRFVHINSDRFGPNGIQYDMVSHLNEDAEKNVWVSTNNGLYRFNTGKQVFANISNSRPGDTTVYHNAVSAIVQTKSHGIWVATWGAGIFSYNNQLMPIPNPVSDAAPSNKNLHSSYMMQRKNGEVWIGTQAGELQIFDASSNKCHSIKPASLLTQTITQLLEDSQGNVWIGTNTGLLVKCSSGNWQDTARAYKTILTGITDVMKLYEDKQQHLWVCTAGDGLYEIDTKNNNTLRKFTEGLDKNDGLLADGATDIVQYNDSLYLIASNGLCILNSKKNSFRYLVSSLDLPAEHITALVTDKQKRIWVAMDGGLLRLTNIDKPLYISYEATDGIINNIFQVSATALLQDGRIMLGTPHDFVMYNPAQTIHQGKAPTVAITGIWVGGQRMNTDSILQLKKLVLPNDNSFIKIELSNFHFSDGFSILYKMEGIDKNWQTAENNLVSYPLLPPGNYTLHLKSRNGENIDNAGITTFHIHVNAPFWKTWWFYSLLLLCTGALLFLMDKWRAKRKESIMKIRSNIANNLHKDISATLDNITVLSEMAKMKAVADPEKSKEFIEQIHSKSQNMALAMDDILWSIIPGNDHMQHFIARFKEYVESLKSRYNTHIDLLVDKNVHQLILKMELRKDVYWLFKGGITSVVKTGATSSKIYFSYEKPWLIYTLEFETAGMNLTQLNNLRLREELKEKLDSLDAVLDFTEHSQSAIFVLKVPIKENG